MSDDDQRDTNGKSSHETAAHAARAAAAAAAVGAALGAVRALTSRGDEDDERAEPNAREDDSTPDGDGADDAEPEATVDTEPPHDEPSREEPVGQNGQTRSGSPGREEPHEKESKPREGASSATVRSVVERAREQLRDLQGRDPESVTALERIESGWRVTCEVVELERIPNSTDVLATYVVELDGDGELLQYERIRRYYRSQADIGGDV